MNSKVLNQALYGRKYSKLLDESHENPNGRRNNSSRHVHHTTNKREEYATSFPTVDNDNSAIGLVHTEGLNWILKTLSSAFSDGSLSSDSSLSTILAVCANSGQKFMDTCVNVTESKAMMLFYFEALKKSEPVTFEADALLRSGLLSSNLAGLLENIFQTIDNAGKDVIVSELSRLQNTLPKQSAFLDSLSNLSVQLAISSVHYWMHEGQQWGLLPIGGGNPVVGRVDWRNVAKLDVSAGIGGAAGGAVVGGTVTIPFGGIGAVPGWVGGLVGGAISGSVGGVVYDLL